MEPVRIINEPTAAAIACNFHSQAEQKIFLVFDIGGGTYDISALCSEKGTIEVDATCGDMNFGGLNLDEVIINCCMQKILEDLTYKNGDEFNTDDVLDP